MHLLPPLTELLAYKNAPVLKLYEQNYPNNRLSAKDAFDEMLKYLWISKKHELDRLTQKDNAEFPSQCFMPRSMREIDEMWHEFILFTEDYSNFCQHYFGAYMHHLPNIFDNMPRPRAIIEEEIAKMLPYIYDHLGEATVRTWFFAYLDEASDPL